jgi:O-antigen biosynthesis protein WbqV
LALINSSSRARSIRLLTALHDMAWVAAVVPIAFLVRTGDLPEWNASVLTLMGALLVASALCFYAFGLNQGSWRYASIEDLLGIIQSAVVAMLIAVIVSFIAFRLETIPRTVPLIGAVALIVLMSAPRLIYRLFKDRYVQRMFKPTHGGERVLLVGYCDEASVFLRSLGRQKTPLYQVVGIIDHGERHVGRKLHAVSVLGTLADLTGIVARFAASGAPIGKIVVGPSKADRAMMEQIVEMGAELGLPVYTLPSGSDLTASDEARAIKPVALRLDDLLGRAHADIDLAPVAAMLRDRVIMVTGGGGSIGSELVNQILSYRPKRLLVLDSSEYNLYAIEHRAREQHPDIDVVALIADVRDRDLVREIARAEQPELVFHAAALKHVPLVEHNPMEGVKTNILGTINVADAAVECGALAFVMISTDKAVNPTNVMGATKRFAEAYCQMLDRRGDVGTKFMTVRFGNVLGSAGSVVPLFTRQIAEGGPVTVTHPDMKRYFMTMREAVRLVLAASAKGLTTPQERGKIMVLDMGTQVRIVDLAQRMIQLAGLRPGVDIEIHFTGLRPGEKLYEERLADSEAVEPTGDAWLQMAQPRVVDPGAMGGAIGRLREAVGERDETKMLLALQAIVPEWTTQHRALRATVAAAAVPEARATAAMIELNSARERLRK